ncbi:ESAT-6 protein secretion system EspG family protein [Actinokineospora auranticolor]|uniref:ESAT-6 protein secretion system EspG family protein n=1 Tax=Actinokineospora auranticolor TaxID=155976 RepID=A0A2S6GX15_9PSEU|nr:ESAT-6 protein secretion system EspG family protein [Actinokineospora auranticolor]
MLKPPHAHGTFAAATRDRWGKRTRTDRVISYFDTEDGRYLQTRVDGWTTISPTNSRRLLHHVSTLLPAT